MHLARCCARCVETARVLFAFFFLWFPTIKATNRAVATGGAGRTTQLFMVLSKSVQSRHARWLWKCWNSAYARTTQILAVVSYFSTNKTRHVKALELPHNSVSEWCALWSHILSKMLTGSQLLCGSPHHWNQMLHRATTDIRRWWEA